ncbi:MAG: regulatory protein RecX [Acetivibrionales bacterium]|jgi:regulatory protein
MEITSVEKNKKNPDQLIVYIDNQFAFSIYEEDYLSLNLYEKKKITQEEINHIKHDINYKRAKSYAIRYLILKVRSELEIRQKLKDSSFDTATINKAIDELKALGYINDRLYVQKYIYDRSKLKPRSKKLLKYELMAKGIEEGIIDEILNEWKMDESVVVEGLLRKKFGKYDLSDEKIMRRAYSFLQYRGFNYEIAKKAINKLISANNN